MCLLPVSLTGDGNDGDMPKEPDLRNIPLHKSPEDTVKVQSLVVEVSSGQLARSVASLANAGEDKVQLGTGVYVGKGLTPFLLSWPIRSRWRICGDGGTATGDVDSRGRQTGI